LEFIKQVKKILKPQGKIILSTPSRERVLADWNNWDFPPHHLTRWNEKSLENIFRMVGIKKNQLFYLEKYKTIAGAIDGKMRSGLVNKVAKDASLGIKSIWIAKIIYLLAKTKYYVMAGIPALFICFFSNILGYKNGIIYAEFQ
jgi:2-polyprenyl-3-methyl-5-hydroxy-6-metoxy-1,4-benzoquinol methylase